MVHVPRTIIRVVRVLEIEIVITSFDLVDGDAPGLLILLPIVPPGFFLLELLDADRLALVVTLGTGRIRMLIVPDLAGRLAGIEEQKVGADAGVGIEYSVGQADDRVQVELA